MNINYGFFDVFGVLIKKFSELVYVVRIVGVFGVKIIGVGGGGCMYVFVFGK